MYNGTREEFPTFLTSLYEGTATAAATTTPKMFTTESRLFVRIFEKHIVTEFTHIHSTIAFVLLRAQQHITSRRKSLVALKLIQAQQFIGLPVWRKSHLESSIIHERK